jgi:hypothetical protein
MNHRITTALTTACGIAAMMLAAAGAQGRQEISVVSRPPATGADAKYVANRAPLRAGPLIKLPVGAFRPSGWLGEFLTLQREGLAGNLGEISVWLTRKDNAWLRTDGGGEYGWEEVPYWLRGYARLGTVLGDEKLIRESKAWIEATLSSQRKNGDFGPSQVKNGKRDLWAQMLMLQVLQAYFETTEDPRVLPFMTAYCRWQMTIPDDQFLEDYWENSRGGDNLASVYWLYNWTGDAFLLELATKIDKNTANWRQDDNLPNWHVVNIAECFRAPATYFLQSGKESDLAASYRNHFLPRERFGQVPGGMFGADENARSGHVDPHQAAETCSFVEQIQSNMMMSEITGDPMWAANTEDIAFNTMPAAFTPDYRALRYLTAPNQVMSDSKNHAPGIANEGPFFLMNPFSSRCCQHNHASAWVNYTEHVWMATLDGGLAAVVHGPGTLKAKAGKGAVTLETTTRYPFEETITIAVKETSAGSFPIYVRIPEWADGASIAVKSGGAAKDSKALKNGAFARISHEWKAGDTITITLPMEIRTRTWAQNRGSISVDRGPLTYSLKIEEKYEKLQSDKHAQWDSRWQPGADPSKWPSYEIMPGSVWNYGLAIDPRDAGEVIEVVSKSWPSDNRPFTVGTVPIELKVPARLIESWQIDKNGLAGKVPASPAATDAPVETVTLVPMGAARLRVSSFPVTMPAAK